MAAPTFHSERAALIIAEAIVSGDDAVCEKHGISKRTLRRWRERVEADQKLAADVRDKKDLVERDWAEKLPDAISKSIEFLGKVATETNEATPEMVHSIAGALKILTDVALSRRLVDARLSRADRNAREADRAGAASGPERVAKVVAIR